MKNRQSFTFADRGEWFLHLAGMLPLAQATRMIEAAATPDVDILRKDEAAALVAALQPKVAAE